VSANLLYLETSPYLLQHKDNAVYWQPWGETVLSEAKRLDRPILLSVGYAACHWCHVMAHESFEDVETARLMNALFINVKVDREERADVDSLYQTALALLGEHGGWPLTMFLTPDAEPFWGGTYFPPESRYGRPAFRDVLRQVADAYRHRRDAVEKNTGQLREHLHQLARPAPGSGIDRAAIDETARHALRLVDPVFGGTLGAPKFPQPVFFRFLWWAYRRTDGRLFREAVTLTLDHLCQGGIYDHLGGGFARYSTDGHWLVPHFEKMLYDNALLVDLLTEAWQDTGSPLYAARIDETISWALRDLRVAQQPDAPVFALASSFDADSEGEEGRFYVWREDEIDALLGAESNAFKAAYDVRPGGNWEGRTILNRSHALRQADPDPAGQLFNGARARLLAARGGRVPPARDDKVLADWNGMMIAALARAAGVFDRDDWRAAAVAIFRFVVTEIQQDGRLFHTWCAGRPRHPATLDDYAAMAGAALALAQLTADDAYLTQARAWVALVDEHYWDATDGGYFLVADDTRDIPFRTKSAHDAATPSGTAMIVEVLARLFLLTGENAYRERAEAIIRIFSTANAQHRIATPGLLSAAEVLMRAPQVVLVGNPEDAALVALRRTALARAPAIATIAHLAPGASLPPTHPASPNVGAYTHPAAWICLEATCELPLTDAAALAARLCRL
jgi:uncharacterized protein YyaL (SSP411 family)